MKKNMSQEKILKKLKSKKINSDEAIVLIKKYFLLKYDLNELFKLLDDFGIYSIIINNVYLIKECYGIRDIEKIDININKECVEIIILNIMVASKNSLYISELSSFFKIYHNDALKFLNLTRLVNMYIKDRNDNLFNFILDNYINDANDVFGAFSKLRGYISDEQKHDFLNKILDCMFYDDLKRLKKSLLPEEFEYIRKKSLTNTDCYGWMINGFIYYDLLTAEKRKEHIDEIVKHGYIENIYQLLISRKLTSAENEKLEKVLKAAYDEYYFYYLVRTDIKFLLGIFGSYTVIGYIIENDSMFQDIDEKEKILGIIEDKIYNELNIKTRKYDDAIKNPVYKVKPKLIKKKRGR